MYPRLFLLPCCFAGQTDCRDHCDLYQIKALVNFGRDVERLRASLVEVDFDGWSEFVKDKKVHRASADDVPHYCVLAHHLVIC